MSDILSSPGERGEPPTVAARLDRMPITRLHVIVVVCVGLGLFFDTYEVLLAGTLSTTLEKQFLLTENSVKAVLASAFVGQFLGAIFLGRVADRVGRRRMFLVNLAVYSVFSLVGGLSPNVWLLIVARFLVGVVGSGLVFAVVAAALAVLIVDVTTLGPRTTGRTLEALAPPDAAAAALPADQATAQTAT